MLKASRYQAGQLQDWLGDLQRERASGAVYRSIPKFKNLPIIMLTARDKFSDKLRGQMVGATHYLTKRVDPKQLLAIVDKCVEVKQVGFSA